MPFVFQILTKDKHTNPLLRGLCADALIAIADANSDNKLNFEEFVKSLDPSKAILFHCIIFQRILRLSHLLIFLLPMKGLCHQGVILHHFDLTLLSACLYVPGKRASPLSEIALLFENLQPACQDN